MPSYLKSAWSLYKSWFYRSPNDVIRTWGVCVEGERREINLEALINIYEHTGSDSSFLGLITDLMVGGKENRIYSLLMKRLLLERTSNFFCISGGHFGCRAVLGCLFIVKNKVQLESTSVSVCDL